MSGPIVTQSGDISLHRDLNRGRGGEGIGIGKGEGGEGNGCMTTLHVLTVFIMIIIFVTSICNVQYGAKKQDFTGQAKKNQYTNRQRDIAIIIVSLLGLVTSIPTSYVCFRNFRK
nr:MAG: wsv414-like protein [Penaeus semisulcatus pemonivirus]